MRLEVMRYTIKIVPEGPTDEAFIEEVLGLRREGDQIALRRANVFNMHALAYLTTSRPQEPGR